MENNNRTRKYSISEVTAMRMEAMLKMFNDMPTMVLTTRGLEAPQCFISPNRKKKPQRNKQRQTTKGRHIKLKLITQKAIVDTLLKHIRKNHEDLRQLRAELQILKQELQQAKTDHKATRSFLTDRHPPC